MSDQLDHYYSRLGPPRSLSDVEHSLIARLVRNTPHENKVLEQLCNALVQDMPDGGMGSIKFQKKTPKTGYEEPDCRGGLLGRRWRAGVGDPHGGLCRSLVRTRCLQSRWIASRSLPRLGRFRNRRAPRQAGFSALRICQQLFKFWDAQETEGTHDRKPVGAHLLRGKSGLPLAHAAYLGRLQMRAGPEVRLLHSLQTQAAEARMLLG